MKHILYLSILIGLTTCQKEQFSIIGMTESFFISSTFVEDDFKIFVYLPSGYSESNNNYPLIVGLDGDGEFENMAGIISEQIQKGNIPSSIFIGIGYGSISDNDKKRNRDYTPTETNGVEDFETGGAANFYKFIREELMPKMESKYRIDSTRKTLMGHSYGGLFTLFAMFQERNNNPFDKFISVAASFWYDSGSIFEFEKKYADTHTDFPVKMYTAMGALEGAVMVASFEEMNEILDNRNYANLKIQHEVLKNYGHSRSDYISYQKGLEYVFNN